MPRYASRPWFSPLGYMASSPQSWPAMLMSLGVLGMFPFRYRFAEYYERQSMGPESEIREKAVRYYGEMERMHRRQALSNHPMWQQDDVDLHNVTAQMQVQSFRIGVTDNEYQYWHAHQRDALRAQKLLGEIEELQQRIAQKA